MTTTCLVIAGLVKCYNVTPVSPEEAVEILRARTVPIVEPVDRWEAIRATDFVVPDGWEDHGAIRGPVFADYVPFSRLYRSHYGYGYPGIFLEQPYDHRADPYRGRPTSGRRYR